MHQRGKSLFFSFLVLSTLVSWSSAQAVTKSRSHSHSTRTHHVTRHITHHVRHTRRTRHRRVIQCVAFVQQSTSFKIHGNARDWWNRAKGLYARGNLPEEGAVLSFRGTRHMPLGHVAVVRSIINSRTIYIDQSHWGTNGISRNVRVVDVSANNDWSAVRVALRSNGNRLGSIYPTHGFIYARPEKAPSVVKHSTLIAANENFSNETASLPDSNTSVFETDAPNRGLR
ncbi:hypothetical protein DM15PD_11020 [Aristophania vespae]|nr:hypothetical protein DM15PD_11020 [Aristophania vespae]